MSIDDALWSQVNMSSFAEDFDGELYLTDVRTGEIYKLVERTN
jgi:hypothetical protein